MTLRLVRHRSGFGNFNGNFEARDLAAYLLDALSRGVDPPPPAAAESGPYSSRLQLGQLLLKLELIHPQGFDKPPDNLSIVGCQRVVGMGARCSHNSVKHGALRGSLIQITSADGNGPFRVASPRTGFGPIQRHRLDRVQHAAAEGATADLRTDTKFLQPHACPMRLSAHAAPAWAFMQHFPTAVFALLLSRGMARCAIPSVFPRAGNRALVRALPA